MTIAGPFTVRPLERSSGGSLDQTAFRVHLSAKELKNLGLTAGDRIRLTTAKRFHGFALAWLAQQTNPGNKPIAKVADLLREKYELALTDALFIERVQEAPRFAASMELVFPPSSEALKKYATKEELEHFAKVALGRRPQGYVQGKHSLTPSRGLGDLDAWVHFRCREETQIIVAGVKAAHGGSERVI